MLIRRERYPGGGIGNYLCDLTHGLLHAKRRRAVLQVPASNFRTFNAQTVRFDFSEADPTDDAVEDLGFFVHGDEQTRALGFKVFMECMREHLLPLIRDEGVFRTLPPDTLVIHVRSGDIFKPVCNDKYGSPPLAWYRRMIEECEYSEILIVTQTLFPIGGQLNPIIEPLRREHPHIEIQSESTEYDFHTLRHARHLALSQGTFSLTAAMLNTGLERLHIPEYPRMPDVNFNEANFRPSTDFDFEIYRWLIDDYEIMRRWNFLPEQIAAMVEHSDSAVRVMIAPRGPQ